MKKLVLLFIAATLGLGLKAQCPLGQAVDFVATDCHGTEVHMFDILDSGQYVLIDFFYTSCGACQQTTPNVVQSYYAMGCNMHDVYYLEVTSLPSDNDEACQNWCQTYGVKYPTISGPAGGVDICNQYGITSYPTVILVAPDRSILINDLWPINDAETVISRLEAQGLQQYDCDAPLFDTIPDFTAPDIYGNEINLYSILDGGQAVLINFFLYGDSFSGNIMNDVTEAYRLYGCNDYDVFFMEITPNGHDDDCQQWVVDHGVDFPTISRDGGGNDIVQSIPVALYPTLMLIRPDHTIAVRDIYPPILDFIFQAMNAEGYEQHECVDDGVEELETSVSVFPNPASDKVNLVFSPDITPTCVELYDYQGRLVLVQDADFETIVLENLSAGVYTLRVTLNNGTSYSNKVVKR